MKKVLAVDDQQGIRLLLKELFSSENVRFIEAASGLEALDVIAKEHPDLILLDMKMPGMDGLELLRHLRQKNDDVKVIMMTAYGELDMVAQANQLGVLSHFTKPFDIEELRTEVMKQLESITA